jgi:hypothetical protein
LYQFYASSQPASSRSDINTNEHVSPTNSLFENQDTELEKFLYDDCGTNGSGSNKLDKYMAESLLKQNLFNILAYRKNETTKYPILSQIACDMMAIQVSTVVSESTLVV